MTTFSFLTRRVSKSDENYLTPPEKLGQRALVLGGGGATGNAWLIGVIAGLAQAGLDVSSAELTVGTSAGATASAQLINTSAAQLLRDIVGVPADSAAPRQTSAKPVAEQLNRLRTIIEASVDAEQMHRNVGAAALALPGALDGEFSERWKFIVDQRFPETSWPQRLIYFTAVEAQTGDLVVFDKFSVVSLPDAVAASCSSGLPYWIADRAYVDGGYRRNENADLAQGYGKVLVLAPLGRKTLHPTSWGMQLAAQIDELQSRGSEVRFIVPDQEAETLMGHNAMNVTLRPEAARQGFRQGQEQASSLSTFWS